MALVRRYTLLYMLPVIIAMVGMVSSCDNSRNSMPVAYDDSYNPVQTATSHEMSAPLGIRYTDKHPLIIVADWDFKPYSYINERGEPSGILVSIIDELFAKMHVEYRLELMEWKEAKRRIYDNEAHLMLDIVKDGDMGRVRYGKRVVLDYPIAVLHPKSKEHIHSLNVLTRRDTIYTNLQDYADQYIDRQFFKDTTRILRDSTLFVKLTMEPNNALNEMLKGRVKYYVWSKVSLQSLVKKYAVEDLVEIDDIDVLKGQFAFCSHDVRLLTELDKRIDILKESGFVDRIVQKKITGTDTSLSLIAIIMIIVVLAAIILCITLYIILQTAFSATNMKREFEHISKMCITLTGSEMIVVKVRKNWIYNISSSIIPQKGCSIADYRRLVHPDDQAILRELENAIDNGIDYMPLVYLRMKKHDDTTDNWRQMSISALVKSNLNRKPTYIYLSLIDETERIIERERLEKQLHEFHDIINVTDHGMAYFDKLGKFINMNDTFKANLAVGKSSNVEQFIQRTTLQELAVLLGGIVIEGEIDMWFCTYLKIPELNYHRHVEVRIHSISDEMGEIVGYTLNFYDRENSAVYHYKNENLIRRITHLENDIKRYHMELDYILSINKMHTVQWKVGEDTCQIYYDLYNSVVTVPLKIIYERIIDKDAETEITEFLLNPEGCEKKARHSVQHFMAKVGDSPYVTDEHEEWYDIQLIPDYDIKGRFVGYFGIRTNITEEVSRQRLLREETAKAQDSVRQKSMFLANMTHEIRTPLNAIKGFADIIHAMGEGLSESEKQEYTTIMMRNSSKLLNVIDDIIQLSLLDNKKIQLSKHRIDFAQQFPLTVDSMKSYLENSDVEMNIVSPLSTLEVTMDYERVMKIIDAFVRNSAKFTKHGSITIGYRVNDTILDIYCSDTGCGIPQNSLKHIFTRFVKLDDFVQGTGLGLSVCKHLSETLGGTIDVKSEEGKGSTFTLHIPIE